ncbi:uncharacterized protein B0H64DRAFT_427413 [Chaetomium fimeti]|uniref:Nephrocystin 3-like N-terminal domain-containing protein n=1 Tax=Chaetomium fimeti TaxID=1854472 RepID=A0AAE0H6Q0_9PEZI|nr:hypothetical protein B0H64DRAFT_427413 [Chaetomium fimeti]
MKAALQTLKVIWNQKVTEELEKELSSVEQSLHLHATVSVKIKLEKGAIQLNDALATLDARTKSLLTSKSFLANFSQLNAHCEEILERQSRTDQLATSRHHELLASLNTVRGEPYTRGFSEWRLKHEQGNLIQDQILASLWFPLMPDREESILSAYHETFEWPGSGKSTLMKFISRHPTTKHLLQEWAGGEDLVIAGFFFHYMGSGLQKSELGAFRGLLYHILSQRRDLIQVAFPERFRALSLSKDWPVPFEPTVIELKTALHTVIQDAPSTHLFLLVDGLDEYNADSAHLEGLVTTLRSLSTSPNVKVLLSSRPWIVFERAFANCPRLQVHDLTRPDIARFVTDKFRQHQRLWDLMPGYERAKESLVIEVVNASCGVFLWVRLAVHSDPSTLPHPGGTSSLTRGMQHQGWPSQPGTAPQIIGVR